jgi:hypothetical protein
MVECGGCGIYYYYWNKELRLGVVGEGDLVNHTTTQMAPTSAETKFVRESLIHKKITQ